MHHTKPERCITPSTRNDGQPRLEAMPAKPSPAAPRPVLGVYDSGAGGLSVLRHLRARRPDVPVLYMADTARVPYGGRPADEILAFNREITDGLVARGARHLVVACNTSCALALPTVRHEAKVPMTGLLPVAARAALRHGRRIGVLATEATIRSGAYVSAVKALDAGATVAPLACRDWVPLVEAGITEGPRAERAVAEALQAWADEPPPDAVILGCTHFPFLADVIARHLPGTPLVDPGPLVADEVLQDLPETPGEAAPLTLLVSGSPEAFLATAEILVPGLDPAEVLAWQVPLDAQPGGPDARPGAAGIARLR